MSPKLFRTYPHGEEDRGIDLTPLFLWLVLLKLLCNQLKIFVNLTFSQKVWPFVLFWFTSCAELRVLWMQQKRSDILVLLWQKCQIFKVFYLWLKKFDTKINAILVISELMASAGKVLRRFRRHGEKFLIDKFLPSSWEIVLAIVGSMFLRSWLVRVDSSLNSHW